MLKNKKSQGMLFILLAVIFVLCYFVWSLKADLSAEIVIRSDTPVWDLRDVDMDAYHVKLLGENCEYVLEAFLTPEEFAKRPDIQVGSPKDAAEYYTARFKMLVPYAKPYAVMFMSVDYADSIYINGELMQTIGRPGDSAGRVIPKSLMVYFTVQPVDGVIEVVHQISNFVHKEGGNPTALKIGSLESASRYYGRQTLVTAMIIGACALLFLVHLVLFMLIKSYRANLYFGLFCFVWMLRISLVEIKATMTLFPELSWYVAFRAEYMAIPLAALLLVLALNAMFEGILHTWAKRVIVAINAAAALFFMFSPTILMTQALPIVYATTLLCAAYVLVRFLAGLRSECGVRQIIILLGLIVFVYLALREMLYHSNILIFPMAYTSMMDFAALVFILFQMVAAFHGTMREVAMAREREQLLAMENALLGRENRLKSDVMDTVSHELRTPLAVMMGYAQLVAKEMRMWGADKDAIADLDAIAAEARRMVRIVEEMQDLSLARVYGGCDEKVQIEAVIRQIARLYEPMLARRGNRLIVRAPDVLPPVIGDAGKLTQVMFNLLNNSGNHTENGEVTITARYVPHETKAESGEIEVTIADTGTGIAPEILPSVFERGVSGDAGGAGLGLAICHEIVTAFGGKIGIESKPGEGTKVTFSILIV